MHNNNASSRNRQIIAMSRDGSLTYDEIGRQFGLTRERVRQIIKGAGIDRATRLAARERRQAASLAADAERIREWARVNPARLLDEAASALDLTAARIRAAVGADAGRLFIRPFHHAFGVRFTDEDIIAALREAAAEVGGTLSCAAYDRYVAVHGGASGVRVLQRFGTWKTACEAAGVDSGTGRGNYKRRWTAGDMVNMLIAYLDSPGATGAFSDYDAWSRGHAERPSGQTIRNHFGSWQAAKTAGLNARGIGRAA